jgi:hypothetical protein
MTPRAERILSLIDSYRLMRSTHVIEFLKYYFNEAVSEQRTVRCLRWLMDEKELIRIRHDPDAKTVAKGSLPKIYGKNSRRNQALNERRDTASLVVPHTLEIVSSIAFNVVRPCRESKGQMRFMDAPDILRAMATPEVRASAKPLTWPVQDRAPRFMRSKKIAPRSRISATISPSTQARLFFASSSATCLPTMHVCQKNATA